MAELKRNTDFTVGTVRPKPASWAAGAADSQSVRQFIGGPDPSASVPGDAGFDPYNHVGAHAYKPGAA